MSGIDVQFAASAEYMSVIRWQHGPEWRPRAHSHSFCELIVVAKGAEKVLIRDHTLICEAGSVLFYPPGWVHEERQHGPDILEFFCVEFEWKECPSTMPILVKDRQGRLLDLARWLESENFTHYAGDAAFRQWVLRLLVAELLRLIVSPSQEVVERVRQFVNDHLQESLVLDDLADHCDINKFHLVRLFRKLTGLTPMEYVRLVRLDTARHLLLSTDLPLKEIAPRVGFADEYHLSRLFKSRYGRGAREMRRRVRGVDVAESAT